MKLDVLADYAAFLEAKRTPGVVFHDDGTATMPDVGRAANKAEVRSAAPHLHEYQSFALAFALARRRAALFLECGLGKTSIALAWVRAVIGQSGRAVICSPLAALHEFENERDKFFQGLDAQIVATGDFGTWLSNPTSRIALVTHHAFVSRRDLTSVDAFVLDESSILKSGSGVIAQNLVASCQMDWRLALSATPAPNDPTEYATHATWLGYMKSDAEFRARFFVRDGKEWRIKKHAVQAMPKWLARFSLWMENPGAYHMPCNALPSDDFSVEYVHVPSPGNVPIERDLFGAPAGAMDISSRAKVRTELYDDDVRMREVVALCSGHRTIVWAIRNAHAGAIERALCAAGLRVAQIAGTTPDDERVGAVRAFQSGDLDVIVSKPSVIGHGVNLQAADRMVFAGYDESYEAMHQAIRRAHRQGRSGTLEVFVMVAPEEVTVVRTLERKSDLWKENAARQQSAFVRALEEDVMRFHRGEAMATNTEDVIERHDTVVGGHYTLVNGDSIAHMAEDMEPESVDLAVFSPPFSSLFTYSSAPEDMGNCSEHVDAEFGAHFHHFARALHRVMRPGRAVALHLAQILAFRARHGRKGLRDFRGSVIGRMEDAGFHYYGEFVIPKNPQAVAIRTKSERLQFTQFKRDSLESSPALNDYVLHFRKPGKQAVPVNNDVSNEEWIRWASGVWHDIDETDVLSYHSARAENDEKHICPLQLTVIERCVRLWSNPGELVLSPFAGIGSEIVTAIRQRRVGYGIELKPEYFVQAVNNCEAAESQTHHQTALEIPA